MPASAPYRLQGINKSPTGIAGLDQISGGGLPTGRTTIVCGGPGCGKTMIGLEFLVRGALQFDEPGVLIAFEETPEEMTQNVASLGFDLKGLVARKKLYMDYVRIEPSQETGDYDLEGLFVRLENAVNSVGAKRVMLDTLEALFSGFSNLGILRSEMRRLFHWLKDRGLTTVLTAERGEGTLTRHGLEEYVSDCVIQLDHRIEQEICTRRMRIVKYRGTSHGADEYAFLIDEEGLSVLPVTGMELQHKVSAERVSTGIADLDEMLGGKGYFRGSTVLISGTAGSGKTTLAARFAEASCERGEPCLFIGFEESRDQVARNTSSVGIQLSRWTKKGLFHHHAWRPTKYGMEMHLLRIHKLVEKFQPASVIIDPVTNLMSGNHSNQVHSMLVRLIDFLKTRGITTVFTSLTAGGEHAERTIVAISSLIDTWIILRDAELNGERNRLVYVVKSRGMAHSNQLREFVMTREGVSMIPAYLGPGGVPTGSSRLSHEAQERAAALAREQEIEAKQSEMSRKRLALAAQIKAMQAELDATEGEMNKAIAQGREREDMLVLNRQAIARSRKTTAASEINANGEKTNTARTGR